MKRGQVSEAEEADDGRPVPSNRLVRVAQCSLSFDCHFCDKGQHTLPDAGLHVALYIESTGRFYSVVEADSHGVRSTSASSIVSPWSHPSRFA